MIPYHFPSYSAAAEAIVQAQTDKVHCVHWYYRVLKSIVPDRSNVLSTAQVRKITTIGLNIFLHFFLSTAHLRTRADILRLRVCHDFEEYYNYRDFHSSVSGALYTTLTDCCSLSREQYLKLAESPANQFAPLSSQSASNPWKTYLQRMSTANATQLSMFHRRFRLSGHKYRYIEPRSHTPNTDLKAFITDVMELYINTWDFRFPLTQEYVHQRIRYDFAAQAPLLLQACDDLENHQPNSFFLNPSNKDPLDREMATAALTGIPETSLPSPAGTPYFEGTFTHDHMDYTKEDFKKDATIFLSLVDMESSPTKETLQGIVRRVIASRELGDRAQQTELHTVASLFFACTLKMKWPQQYAYNHCSLALLMHAAAITFGLYDDIPTAEGERLLGKFDSAIKDVFGLVTPSAPVTPQIELPFDYLHCIRLTEKPIRVVNAPESAP